MKSTNGEIPWKSSSPRKSLLLRRMHAKMNHRQTMTAQRKSANGQKNGGMEIRLTKKVTSKQTKEREGRFFKDEKEIGKVELFPKEKTPSQGGGCTGSLGVWGENMQTKLRTVLSLPVGWGHGQAENGRSFAKTGEQAVGFVKKGTQGLQLETKRGPIRPDGWKNRNFPWLNGASRGGRRVDRTGNTQGVDSCCFYRGNKGQGRKR